jgi:hypothetical protein
MAEGVQNGQECFPSKDGGERLPIVLMRSAVGSHLEQVYTKLLKRLPDLFTGVKLQQNRGRLSAAFDVIRKKADLPKDRKIEGEMVTFGDLRAVRKRINDCINEALQATSGGATLDDSIQVAIREEFESECTRYRTLIGGKLLFDDAPVTLDEIPVRADAADNKVRAAGAPERVRILQTTESRQFPKPDPLLPLSTDEILKASPALIIRYMDGINEQSNGGLEDDVKPIIAELGIPWASFRHWRDDYEVIAIAATILAASHHDGKVGRLKQGVVQWVMRSVRMECNGDEQRIGERMEELGLGAHYAYRSKEAAEDAPEPKERVRRKVEPLIDPRWKFLQNAPRRELTPKPVKVKKVKRERDPRLLDEDYQLLLLTRRLLKAVETDQPDPWVYAIGKLTKSLDEKTETKLA